MDGYGVKNDIRDQDEREKSSVHGEVSSLIEDHCERQIGRRQI